MPPDATADWAKRGAAVLLAAFENYRERFAGITARARRHFELRDWSAVPRDSMRRLDVYGECVGEGLSQLRARLGALAGDRATRCAMRDAFAAPLAGRAQLRLAACVCKFLVRRTLDNLRVGY